MKTNTFRQLISIGFLLFLIACSTKKDTFLARKSHALSTKYNILYNGQIGLDKGVVGIKANSKDDFWKRLPIEKMQIKEDFIAGEKPKNADFELAETKATKAIQKHSMNIDGREKNSQIDEAYLLLGKSRYYDQRFVPALDAFNYILYKYPNSSNIYEAKIWREKTNMRLGNDALVVKNISKLLDEQKLSNQVVANANALLSEAFLNLEEKDSAVAKLKIAEEYTKIKAEKARYRFILGQLYEELGKKDSAMYSYQSVIDMKRKAAREYVIQAQAKKAQLFDYEKGDTTVFSKTFKTLVADRENRPFLDVIYYQMGVFHDKNNNQKQALKYYNSSLKKATTDQYLIASNYRNLGNMYFKNAEYPIAAKYYDSTLVKLDSKSRGFLQKKIRKNLDEVIAYDLIAKKNDSIINIISLSKSDRISYFENYIVKLKRADKAKSILEEKQKVKSGNIGRNTSGMSEGSFVAYKEMRTLTKKKTLEPPSISENFIKGVAEVFYFYNPVLVAFGNLEFKKVWGERLLNRNWRLSDKNSIIVWRDTLNNNSTILKIKSVSEEIQERYTVDYYLKLLPLEQIRIDSIVKERNNAYYQLGIIYKEKFKEYQLASIKFEQLLRYNPEKKLIPSVMYNLYKIYQIIDISKAEPMKKRVLNEYPNSRYVQMINNASEALVNETESEYNKWYKLYREEQFLTVLEKADALISQFSGDEIVSKFELLKANAIGKLRGVAAYKNALQYVADNYPNSEEGKNAQEIVTTQIPFLEQMNFNTTDTKNWKILYKVGTREDKNTKAIEDKIKKFNTVENFQNLTFSYDVYTEKENFITIHGINSEVYANTIVKALKEDKKYKIDEPAIVISNENYKVIQIKKNLDAYLAPKNQ
ncbi:type IX secretion system periplasmic lipoprotein PorW/SprE [Flavobacterium xinjiangense]|uniref:Tetratricopeptide repeat-containing protein n=1 Tax=Flavobacterium xinjiangense TaxID=178356 RepID=A0A1M7MEQ6_9FLAO|nr:tetratricopeptide repeat protein [Flavobacterium xinjiangense]SHM89343.1 Tetratricopeptide repeat-containing protein [Flavobacterium xinjiangense]